MNTPLTIQQLLDLRILLKTSKGPTVSKEVTLILLDECILHRRSERPEGSLQPFRAQGNVFGCSEDYGA